MKRNHNKLFQIKHYLSGLVLALGVILSQSAGALAPLDLATIPLANSPTVPIKPNLLFIFDDSGSMGRDHMPDWADSGQRRLFRNSSYNTVYYNPALTYSPPVNFTGAGLDITTYPSQIGTSNATGKGSGASPNWKDVQDDAYLGSADTNLTNRANYYTVIPGEYCKRADLKECAVQASPTLVYAFPAHVRWCNTNGNANAVTPAANSCQAARLPGFVRLRIPALYRGRINITNGASGRVTSVKVAGLEILSEQTQLLGGDNLEKDIVKKINACTGNITLNCTIAGYSARRVSDKVEIYAPAPTSATPVVIKTGGVSRSINAFAPMTSGNVPGILRYVSINKKGPSYTYPGSATAAPTRSDCAGASCTYVEEMTNFANWFTYYHTRRQMMKTAVSLAFKDIGDDFRVGFMATSTLAARSLDFDTFDTTQKAAWYSALFSTTGGRWTPLRGSLATAGRIYANKTSAHGVFSDPVQYECQQNFAMLTTDGYWNTNEETGTFAGPPRALTSGNVGNNDSAALGTPLGKREGVARSNTLADVAAYYRQTDIRTAALGNCIGGLGGNVCETVTGSPGAPPNQKQTMVTFTLGLGIDGTLSYSTDYKTATSGDYYDITQGIKNWPNPIQNDEAERIDDLWHAAVNGDGTYFSAKNPNDVVSQLKEAVSSILVKVGGGAAAATSTLNPIAGNNFAYVASYTSGFWAGNLEKRKIQVGTGEVLKVALACVEDVVPSASCSNPSYVVSNGPGYDCVTPNVANGASCPGVWNNITLDCAVPTAASCTGTLKSMVGDFTSVARKIKINVAGTLQEFNYANLALTSLSTAEKDTFEPAYLAANLTQWPALTATQMANVTGPNLVNYLRGEKGYEQGSATPDNRVFRKRQAVLGDIVGSKPAFIGEPTFNYGDLYYSAFKAAKSSRLEMVYVGTNDGMLHAFNADTLVEQWAYIPTEVLPKMWKLADENYSAKHSFYVNGDVIISDICVASCASVNDWRTILVGGLDSGGRGYYALDITNPSSPSLLWEFAASGTINNDPNLGYTFSNPIITKRAIDGKWVVIFASGYNNIPDNDAFYNLSATKFKPNNPAQHTTGDGLGRLFILNAATGVKLGVIDTSAGSVASPSGLSKIAAFSDDAEKNNTTKYVYGGDLLGNLWRFNIDNNTVLKFANFEEAGKPQPITTAPELGLINNKRVVFTGTGKYLEIADLSNTDKQSLYAIKDDDATVSLLNPRSILVPQTIVPSGPDSRETGVASPVNFATGRGWYLDFPDTGERQNVESLLVLGTLLVPTAVPTSTACQPAGYGWFNFLDYRTGASIATAGGVVSSRTTAPVVGFNVVYVDGKPKVSIVVANDPDPRLIPDVPFTGSGTGFQTKRSIWREIIE